MKSFIKILFAFALLLTTTVTVHAQLRQRVMPAIAKGNSIVLGTTGFTVSNTGIADTLAVSDTLDYRIPFTGPNSYLPFISYGWTKIGSGTATVVVNFYEGNTPYNFTTVKAGVANAAYTKTLTLSASTTGFIDFLADSAKISGKYLKITETTSSTASVQGSIITNVNTSYK